MGTKLSSTESISTAASVAPEDIARGDYVAVSSELVEFPSFFWCDSALADRGDVVRVRYLPGDNVVPLCVEAICLPFVFVRRPSNECEMIDVRRVQLVKLKKRFARTVWREYRAQSSKRKRKRNRR